LYKKNNTPYLTVFMTDSTKMPPCTPTATAVSAIKLVQDEITDGFYFEGIENTALLIVSDLHCKVMIKQTIADGELVSTSSLRKGTYIVKLITDTGMVEKKLAKA
jgi:hypothetical protein